MIKNKSDFCWWKTVYFHFWFLGKWTCTFPIERNFSKNDVIFHIINQNKVLSVLLWIGYDPSLNGGSLEITLTVPLTCDQQCWDVSFPSTMQKDLLKAGVDAYIRANQGFSFLFPTTGILSFLTLNKEKYDLKYFQISFSG